MHEMLLYLCDFRLNKKISYVCRRGKTYSRYCPSLCSIGFKYYKIRTDTETHCDKFRIE
jgi:hypothetical protein